MIVVTALPAAVLCAASLAAGAACEAPRADFLNASVLAERQPRIQWNEVSGATGYRVRLLSRVPNGRILASHDTVIASPSFLAPQPLAEHRAKVTVRLNAVCGAEESTETAYAFVIDTSSRCTLEELSAGTISGVAELKWRPVAGAANYEVRAFALDGQSLSSVETRATEMKLALGARSAVVSVHPLCTSGSGEALYRVVAAD
jgi:hypothetical protein